MVYKNECGGIACGALYISPKDNMEGELVCIAVCGWALAATFTLRTFSFEVILAATLMALHHPSVRRLRVAVPPAALAAEVRVVGLLVIVVPFIRAPSALV